MAKSSKQLLFVACVSALTSACAFSPQLQRIAVDHDQMVAETEDELMLRNILRARFRYPLHFTSIIEVNGDAQLSVGGSLGASFPGTSASRAFSGTGGLTGSSASDGATSISPALNGSVTTRPSFKAAVLSTDKFQRGLQRPVSGELVAYYLDAGWRDDLLMALFVERLDVVDKQTGKRLASVHNDPNDAYGFERVICNFSLKSHRIEDRYELAKASDVFKAANLQGVTQEERPVVLQEFVNLLKDEKIAFDTEKISFKTNSSYSVTLTHSHDRCAGADYSRSKQDWQQTHGMAALANGEIRNGLTVVTGGTLLDTGAFKLIGPSKDGAGGYNARYLSRSPDSAGSNEQAQWRDVSLEVHFRSVQDVIYFLGEYIRAGKNAYQIPREYFFTQCGATSAAPLRRMRWIIDVQEGSSKGAITTRFEDKHFSIASEDVEGPGRCGIAGGESSRSLQVISLVEQLLNLNKSADQLPTSISVRAIP